MIKAVSLIFFISLISCNSVEISQRPDCPSIRDGVFTINIDTPYFKGEVTRKGKIQVEKNLTTGETGTMRVQWINDCTYSLTYISQSDSALNYLKNKELIVEITKIDGDTVYTVSHLSGTNLSGEIKMVKIK